MEKVFVRAPYNYDVNEASDESGLRCRDASLAQQSFAEEVDINTIVRRFGLDGELPVGVRMPTYGDFTGIGDFQDAMNAVVAAKESFEQMPARVRARFDNDPAKFVEFCSDERNAEEAGKLGLVKDEVVARAAALAAEEKAKNDRLLELGRKALELEDAGGKPAGTVST